MNRAELTTCMYAGKMYYTQSENNAGAIMRSNMDGTEVETIRPGVTGREPKSLALDLRQPGGACAGKLSPYTGCHHIR